MTNNPTSEEQQIVFEAMEHDWTEEELEDFYHQVNG